MARYSLIFTQTHTELGHLILGGVERRLCRLVHGTTSSTESSSLVQRQAESNTRHGESIARYRTAWHCKACTSNHEGRRPLTQRVQRHWQHTRNPRDCRSGTASVPARGSPTISPSISIALTHSLRHSLIQSLGTMSVRESERGH